MWLAEAVATKHFLLFFPSAIVPKCSKFSNIHDLWPLSIICPSGIRGLISLVEVTNELVRSQPEHRSRIFL